MGLEIKCRVDFSGESSEGKALFETSELIFRGAFRLKIPFRAITTLEASRGRLSIQYPDGQAVFISAKRPTNGRKGSAIHRAGSTSWE